MASPLSEIRQDGPADRGAGLLDAVAGLARCSCGPALAGRCSAFLRPDGKRGADCQLATAAKLRDVWRGRISVSFERCHVLFDSFERGSRYPTKHCPYDEVLVWVHFDVENLRVACHRGAGGEHIGAAAVAQCRSDERR